MQLGIWRASEAFEGYSDDIIAATSRFNFLVRRGNRCLPWRNHTAPDTLDKVEPRELQENAAVMAVLAYTLANLPGNLERPAPKPSPAE
jgi:hypothetical protein